MKPKIPLLPAPTAVAPEASPPVAQTTSGVSHETVEIRTVDDLNAFIETSLEQLEAKFASFTTRNSLSQIWRKSR